MPDIAVIIVTWNVRELAVQTLHSLLQDLDTSRLDAAVYVVDNASSDKTAEAIAEAFPQVTLYALDKNLGFGGGNNYALRQIGFGDGPADGPADPATPDSDLPRAVYLLNADTITQPGATQALYDTLMHMPSAGWVGARLTYGDGSFQDGAFMFPGLCQLWAEFFPTPGRFILGTFNGRYPRTRYQSGMPFRVDFTLGATVMLKREVIQQTGMFDEAFFMYCEEIDWAWRVRRAGWGVWCVPSAHVVHLGGQSTSQVRPRSTLNLWTSRLLLFDRYFPRWKRWIARRMIASGMRRKAAQTQDAEMIATYQQIRAMALE